MGLIGALTGQQRVQIIQNNQTVIQLDCSVSETHSRESPPTEFPVENGQTISDHVIVKPFALELQGIISDTPIGTAGQLLTSAATTLTSSLVPPAGVIAGAAAVAGGSALFTALKKSKTPSVAAFLQLIQLQQNAQPVSILTSLNRYENMWIKNISVPRDNATGKSLVFTVQFVQLLLVSPQSVNIAIFANPALAAAEANAGDQGLDLSKKYQQGFDNATKAVKTVIPGGVAGG